MIMNTLKISFWRPGFKLFLGGTEWTVTWLHLHLRRNKRYLYNLEMSELFYYIYVYMYLYIYIYIYTNIPTFSKRQFSLPALLFWTHYSFHDYYWKLFCHTECDECYKIIHSGCQIHWVCLKCLHCNYTKIFY